MASAALINMGLTQSTHEQCLFHGVPSTDEFPAGDDDPPLTIGLYVDDMVYYSTSDDVEQ